MEASAEGEMKESSYVQALGLRVALSAGAVSARGVPRPGRPSPCVKSVRTPREYHELGAELDSIRERSSRGNALL